MTSPESEALEGVVVDCLAGIVRCYVMMKYFSFITNGGSGEFVLSDNQFKNVCCER